MFGCTTWFLGLFLAVLIISWNSSAKLIERYNKSFSDTMRTLTEPGPTITPYNSSPREFSQARALERAQEAYIAGEIDILELEQRIEKALVSA